MRLKFLKAVCFLVTGWSTKCSDLAPRKDLQKLKSGNIEINPI